MLFFLFQVEITSSLSLDSAQLQTAERIVSKLRSKIFVEKRYLEYLKVKCSSLDGPNCNKNSEIFNLSDYPEIGFSNLEPILSAWELLHSKNPQISETQGSYDQLSYHLDISGDSSLIQDRRLPAFYSAGLPDSVIASWDGKWLVNEGGIALSSYSPGYLRLSKPVLVKSIFVDTSESEDEVHVVLRLNNSVVWSSKPISRSLNGPVDVCLLGFENHVPLSGIDEIAVFSKSRKAKIIGIDLYEAAQKLSPVLLLTPSEGTEDKLSVKPVLVDTAVFSKDLVVSLEEVARRKMKLRLKGRQEDVSKKTGNGEGTFSKLIAGHSFLPVEQVFDVVKTSHTIPSELRKAVLKLPKERVIEIGQRVLDDLMKQTLEGIAAEEEEKSDQKPPSTSSDTTSEEEEFNDEVELKDQSVIYDIFLAAFLHLQ
jgi:hypothetical protein